MTVTDRDPSVTALTFADGSVHLRCVAHFIEVLRTNAHVTWHDADGEHMPLVIATAMSATTKSPGCKSTGRRRRRRKRDENDNSTQPDAGNYKCRIRWDKSRPFIPNIMHEQFLTLATSPTAPELELCVATDPCGKSESHIVHCVSVHAVIIDRFA